MFLFYYFKRINICYKFILKYKNMLGKKPPESKILFSNTFFINGEHCVFINFS